MNYLKTYLPYLFGNKKGQKYKLPQEIPWESLSFEESLMFHALVGTLTSYVKDLNYESLSDNQKYHLLNFTNQYSDLFFSEAVNARSLNVQEAQELLDFNSNQLMLFAILPTNRRSLGTLLIKKSSGEFLKDDCGNIWSLRILACSGRGLPFHHSNGQTPMGVYSIDGVMPTADKNYEFGKFRRLIVNFTNVDKLIPPSHFDKSWWKQGKVAEVMGRSLLRIHGTGRVNNNPFLSFYPFVPTSGCIATNEKSNDQQNLLDALMKSQGLESIYENEAKINAKLLVFEFNDSFQKLIF